MKLNLIAIGKTTDKYLEEGIDVYQKRLKHYCSFSLEILPDIKNAGSLEQKVLLEKEGELILSKISKRDFVVLLDEKGKLMRSVEFASAIEKWQVQGIDRVVFVVGGAFGFSESVYQRAGMLMSLSPMTFNHRMVRLIFAEQLYRAFSIIKGEPYHHE